MVGNFLNHCMAKGQAMKIVERGAISEGQAGAVVRFADLWETYPTRHPYLDKETGKSPKGYENQCAIKVSVALHKVGIEMKSFAGAAVDVDGRKAAVRAEQLANWLKKQPFPALPAAPAMVAGTDWQDKIDGKTGIIYFANYWKREGETDKPTGDHIDLWNRRRLTNNGFLGTMQTFLRFTLKIHTGPGFSDLRNSTEILFWEIQ